MSSVRGGNTVADNRSDAASRIPEDPLLREMINWVRARIRLRGFKVSMWAEEQDTKVIDFLTHPEARRVAAFMYEGRLAFQPMETAVAYGPTQFVWFVRRSNAAVTPSSIAQLVTFGLVNGDRMDSLLRAMGGVFAARVMTNATWPDSVKKEFTNQVHRFMASLVETANQAKGKTVLYLPQESVELDESAAKDKDLVQRLESTVIHWTRQIKEVVNNEDNSHNAETAGPLDEINFWRSRTIDLSGISEQLNRAGVRRIVAVLNAAKSSFLGPFEKLAELIRTGSSEANDNLRFLNILTEPCEQLAKSEPKEIPPLLPDLLNRVRVIGTVSQKYTSPERLTGLLRKISNEIINRCCAKIDLDDVFDNDVLNAMQALNESIDCGNAWRRAFDETADAIEAAIEASDAKLMPRAWDFDRANIFAQIEAFMQRCRDLLEVCEGQLQFARKSLPEGKQAPLPAFGGSRGPEIAKSLLGIEERFAAHVDRLRTLKDFVLDVKATQWHDDYNGFKNGVKDLEVMMCNVINGAFEGVGTIEANVQLLEAFHSLARRDTIKRCVEQRTLSVFMLFKAKMTSMKLYVLQTHDHRFACVSRL